MTTVEAAIDGRQTGTHITGHTGFGESATRCSHTSARLGDVNVKVHDQLGRVR